MAIAQETINLFSLTVHGALVQLLRKVGEQVSARALYPELQAEFWNSGFYYMPIYIQIQKWPRVGICPSSVQ